MDAQTYCKLLRVLNADLSHKAVRANIRTVDLERKAKDTWRNYLNRLHNILVTHLDDDGLNTFCFKLGIDYDALPAKGRDGKARELIKRCDRSEIISKLWEHGHEQYPNIWNIPQVTRNTPIISEYLGSALQACETGDIRKMSEWSEEGLKLARECNNEIGKAVALAYTGMAYALMGDFKGAGFFCEEASETYHNYSNKRFRRSEGIVTYGLGLIAQHDSTWLHSNQDKRIGNYQVTAMNHYEQAQGLFKQAMERYSGVTGDNEQYSELVHLHQDVELRKHFQIRTVYVDGNKYGLAAIGGRQQTLRDLQPHTDYRPIIIGGDTGTEFDIPPGYCVLIRIPSQDEDDTELAPDVYRDERAEYKFLRDAEGKLRVIPPGADETGANYVDAVFEPAS